MKHIILLLITYHLSLITFSQDSVSLKITRIATTDGKHVIWMKDVKTKDRYITQCPCKVLPPEYKKGNTIKLAATQMQIIKQSFTKKDLEN